MERRHVDSIPINWESIQDAYGVSAVCNWEQHHQPWDRPTPATQGPHKDRRERP